MPQAAQELLVAAVVVLDRVIEFARSFDTAAEALRRGIGVSPRSRRRCLM
jgi:hypothetical protein